MLSLHRACLSSSNLLQKRDRVHRAPNLLAWTIIFVSSSFSTSKKCAAGSLVVVVGEVEVVTTRSGCRVASTDARCAPMR